MIIYKILASIIRAFNLLLKYLNLNIISVTQLERLRIYETITLEDLFLKNTINSITDEGLNDHIKNFPAFTKKLIDFSKVSKSQIGQDLFVLSYLNFKNSGFFVEIGATDGVKLSNTYALETTMGWTGILSEPARIWHKALNKNRTCSVDTRCVWKNSGEIKEFHEATIPELSTIADLGKHDWAKPLRTNYIMYNVPTVSLTDLLKEYKAPARIDYLSLDTEGSEYEILKEFDFRSWQIEIITCEHNFTSNRSKIFKLLKANGYKRVHEDVSEFDDWYVKI